MSWKRIKHPQVVAVGDEVVKGIKIDRERNRVSLAEAAR